MILGALKRMSVSGDGPGRLRADSVMGSGSTARNRIHEIRVVGSDSGDLLANVGSNQWFPGGQYVLRSIVATRGSVEVDGPEVVGPVNVLFF